MKTTPEDIVVLLKSISKFSLEDEGLDVWFEGSITPMSAYEFIHGSFTRDLLDLVEKHLLKA